MLNFIDGVLVIGSFGYCNNQLDGQTIKTRQVYQLLKDKYDGRVEFFCSMSIKRNPILFLFLFYKVLRAKTIISIYATSGGFQTMLPVMYKLTVLLRKKLIYIAIGSTQIDCIEGKGIYKKARPDLLEICSKIKGCLVETNKVKNIFINKYKLHNIDLFPNFRYFDENICFSPASTSTLRLVFMARITPKKGYDVAFEFFNYIKGKNLDIALDFYGPLDGVCNDDFFALIEKYKNQGVQYKGVLQQSEIYSTLLNYDVMVFPTLIDGIPGSIIDAYISSVTVVATNWEYAHEIIDDKKNGFIVAYDNPEKQKQFNEAILKLYYDRDLLSQMKFNAFKTREKFSNVSAWNVLNKYL